MTYKPKVKYTPEGDPVFTVVGIPFSGPVNGKADLVGDWFDKSTNLGPLEEVLSYFDHGRSDDWVQKEVDKLKSSGALPEDFNLSGFGKHLIGKAVRRDTTEEGVLYDIIVDRNHKWADLLVRLFEDGHLGASSKASARINDTAKSGRVDEWHVVAMDLTPSSMNPDAKAVFVKSLALEELTMTAKAKAVTEVTPTDNAADAVVENDTETVSDRVEKAFGADDVPDQPPTEDEAADESAVQAPTLADIVADLSAQVIALREEIEKSATLRDDRLKGIEDALPTLAKNISKQLRATVRDETAKSADERVADQAARNIARSNSKATGPTRANAQSGAPGF